jgi:hypothetical protein
MVAHAEKDNQSHYQRYNQSLPIFKHGGWEPAQKGISGHTAPQSGNFRQKDDTEQIRPPLTGDHSSRNGKGRRAKHVKQVKRNINNQNFLPLVFALESSKELLQGSMLRHQREKVNDNSTYFSRSLTVSDKTLSFGLNAAQNRLRL